MFNGSGDQMDVTSPGRPDPKATQNTLPAFLLGSSSNNNFNSQDNNLTPLKGRNPNQLSNSQLQQVNNLSPDIENRPPPLLFSSKYGQNKNPNLVLSRPFGETQPNKKISSGPPVASLGQNYRNFSSEPKLPKPSYNVMASSPLPDKQGHLPRITTPDFSNSQIDNSPILTSPIPKQQPNQNQGTPLSRQVLEKRHLKQTAVSPEESINNTSFPLEDEIGCWISLFGFNPKNKEKIIKCLTSCGSIVCRQPSKKHAANWIHLRFASPNQAKRARQRFNGRILDSEGVLVGVVECVEPSYILDYIKGCGANTSNVTNLDMDMSKVGMRSLVESKSSEIERIKKMEDDPFNIPQQESNSVVRRTLTYLLPNYF